MRFRSLGSGSAGNATLIEAGEGPYATRVLVDCGFGLREMETRLRRAGVQPDQIDLIFVTHEHGDHVGGALPFARRHGAALAMSDGTWRTVGDPETQAELDIRITRDGDTLQIKGLALQPFTVPHDAREPLQLCLSDGQCRLGVLTDLGCETPHVVAALQACTALLLECNHDEHMLAAGPYPAVLKQRVGGRLGHLGNHQAASILSQCLHPGLSHVVAAHLSEQNNTPELALAAIQAVVQQMGGPAGACKVLAASQHEGTDWITL